MAFVHFRLAWFGLAVLLGVVESGRHLRAKSISTQDAERSVLAELAESLRKADGTGRIIEFEAALRPMFAALPKDRYGSLNHKLVRYALHRLFMDRRSWQIRGLDPAHDHGDRTAQFSFKLGSIPVLPTLLQETMEEKHHGVGLSLRETATLAAALDDLVHRENLQRLTMAYDTLGMALNETQQISATVTAYMTIYLLGSNFSTWDTDEIKGKMELLLRSRRWAGLKPFVSNVQEKALTKHGIPMYEELNFNDTIKVVEALGENFGSFNDKECKALKQTLLSMETRIPGRVRLSDFYNMSRFGVWGFTEKKEYLRDLGVLDESNESNPQVVVANYVTSTPQCLQGSSVYLTCCRSECEDLMGIIESKVAAPEVDPAHIVGIVSLVRTDTVVAPRELSQTLLSRLQNIADHHGGRVPIHGRLFAQWMHTAFPRECPYPHKSGTVNPQTADEWMQSTGQADSQYSDEEMLEHIRPDDSCAAEGQDAEHELPWSFSEELFTASKFDLPTSRSSSSTGVDTLTTRSGQKCLIIMLPLVAAALYFSTFVRELLFTTSGKTTTLLFTARKGPVLHF